MAKKGEKSLELFPGWIEQDGEPAKSSTKNPDRAISAANVARPSPSPDLAGKSVYIIDSHSLIYQVYHAISEMTAPDGRPVNAVFGFVRDVLDILSKHEPDYLVCAFDHSDITFRNDIFPEYKAHRDPMPDSLREQIEPIQSWLNAMGIPIVDLPGFEADDILATFARQVTEAGARLCVLVTSDKDCRQLINDRVRLLNLRKGTLYGAEELKADWGILPEQVVDFQAMVGDSVDNVPGIPSIGPKTATQLLEEFGTLEKVLASVGSIKGKKAEKIAQGADQARISQQLVRLDNQVPLSFEWIRAAIGQWNIESAVEFCRACGFRGLTDRIAKLSPVTNRDDWQSDYQTINESNRLKEVIAEAIAMGSCAFDTETTAINPNWADIVGVSLCVQPGVAYYVPVRAPREAKVIDQETLSETLRPLLENPAITIIGQNLKYDIIMMRGCGIHWQAGLFDTMVADYLIDPGRNTHNMDELAARYLGHDTIKISSLIGSGKNQGRMDDVDVAKITQYAAEDADVPMRLKPILEKQLTESGLEELFQSVEMPLIQVLVEMEFNGIYVDGGLLSQISGEFAGRLRELEQGIWKLAGVEFNIDSPSQLGEVLFDQLGLKPVRKTRTGRSTDAAVLETLAEVHQLPALVIEYRQLAKLKSTYADALVQQINPRTGRVHTSFMQDVARTGRLSSKEPNLQNIPIRTAEGRRIREAFIAEPGTGNVLLTADWSQIELRMLAHFCEDEVMLAAFRNGDDIHRVVAAEVNGIPQEQVTPEMRRQAKAINFGIIYGQTPWGLARELGISREDATEFIRAYFERYPAVDGFMRTVLEQAATDHCVKTILGRRRPVEGVRKPGPGPLSRNRSQPERVAINTVIQGSAADLIKLAMIRLYQQLKASSLNTRMLLQIHDELLFEVPRDELPQAADLIRKGMTSAADLKVPLEVVIETGNDWNNTELWQPDNPPASEGTEKQQS